MSKPVRFLFKIILPVFILLLGGAVWKYYDVTKPQITPRRSSFTGTLVEVSTLKQETRKIQIQTHGIVRAKERVVLTPPIAGIVDYISPSLVEGGYIRAEEVLLGIKPATGVNTTYTEVEAPFNGIVQAMDVSRDQYVSPGFAIATLIGSDTAQVKVDLPLREMAQLPLQRIPNQFNIPAEVMFTYGNRTQVWNGIVQYKLPELTPKGGMAQLLIEIQDPFQLKASHHLENPSIPLFIGAFVEVAIPAQTFRNVFIIPAHTLRDQNTVYLEKEGLLEIRSVAVAYIQKDEVFISNGVQAGEKLITSPLKAAVPGSKVRVAGEEGQSAKVQGQSSQKRPPEGGGKNRPPDKSPRSKEGESGKNTLPKKTSASDDQSDSKRENRKQASWNHQPQISSEVV